MIYHCQTDAGEISVRCDDDAVCVFVFVGFRLCLCFFLCCCDVDHDVLSSSLDGEAQ